MGKTTIDVKKFTKFLNEYLPYEDAKIRTLINAGGCGWFALYLSDVLDNMKVKYTIQGRYRSKWDGDYDTLIRFKKNENYLKGNRVAEDHITIKIGDKVIDSSGFLKQRELDYFSVPVSMNKKQLSELVLTPYWNDIFDKTLMPKIKQYVNNIPKAYKNWVEGQYSKVPKKVLNSYTKSHDWPF